MNETSSHERHAALRAALPPLPLRRARRRLRARPARRWRSARVPLRAGGGSPRAARPAAARRRCPRTLAHPAALPAPQARADAARRWQPRLWRRLRRAARAGADPRSLRTRRTRRRPARGGQGSAAQEERAGPAWAEALREVRSGLRGRACGWGGGLHPSKCQERRQGGSKYGGASKVPRRHSSMPAL